MHFALTVILKALASYPRSINTNAIEVRWRCFGGMPEMLHSIAGDAYQVQATFYEVCQRCYRGRKEMLLALAAMQIRFYREPL